MRIYWTTKLVPELTGLSASQRARVLRECNYAHGAFFVVLFLAMFVSSFLGSWLLRRFNPDLGFIGIALGGGLYFGMVGLLVSSIRLERLRPYIRHYLKQHSDELKSV